MTSRLTQGGGAFPGARPTSWPGEGRGRRLPRLPTPFAVGVAATALVTGMVVAISTTLAAVAGAAILAIIAINSRSARFAVVVAGGLFVLGSSDGLDVSKIAYLIWVGLATGLAIAGIAKERVGLDRAVDSRLLVVSAALTAAVAMSLLVAQAARTPFVDSLRDAAPYCLLAVAPLLAADVIRSRLGRHMEGAIVAAGLFGTVGFAGVFLARRGITDVELATVGSGSLMLAALVFSVASAALLAGSRRRVAWAILGAVVLALLLATGTRSTLVLLVAPVAIVLAHGDRFQRLVRLTLAVAIVGALALALVEIAGRSSLIDMDRLGDRVSSLVSLGSDLSADQSYIERVGQIGAATSALATSPVVGVGFGFRFEWMQISGPSLPSYTIDTGLALPAKFGFLGLALFGVALLAIRSFFSRQRGRIPEHVRLSVIGFAAITMAALALGNPLDDKGFGLAISMLLAWTMTSATRTGLGPTTVASRTAVDRPSWQR